MCLNVWMRNQHSPHISARAVTLINDVLGPCLEFVHATRYACLLSMVQALLRGGRLSASGLGRSLDGPGAQKHDIKKVDRTLGNKHLQTETTEIFGVLARA